MTTKVPLTIDDLKANQEAKSAAIQRQKEISIEYEKRLRYDMQHEKYTPPEYLKDEPLLQQNPAVYGGETVNKDETMESNEKVEAVILKEDSD